MICSQHSKEKFIVLFLKKNVLVNINLDNIIEELIVERIVTQKIHCYIFKEKGIFGEDNYIDDYL